MIFCGPFLRFCKFSVTDIRSSDGISHGSQSDGLCPNATSTIQNFGSLVKAIAAEYPVQDNSLLMGCGLPVKEKLIILRSQTIIKGLCDIHVLVLVQKKIFRFLVFRFDRKAMVIHSGAIQWFPMPSTVLSLVSETIIS
jgi:hypothetical protein